jgi:hypothetical protein
VAVDVGPASSLQDTRLRNRRDATPVKLGEILEDGEVRFPDRSFDPPSLPVGHFFLDQSQEVSLVGEIGPRCAPLPAIDKRAQNGTSVSRADSFPEALLVS